MDENERKRPLDERIATTCGWLSAVFGVLLTFYILLFAVGPLADPPEGLISVWATPVALLALAKIGHWTGERTARRHTQQARAEIAAARADIAELSKKLDQISAAALTHARDAAYWKYVAEGMDEKKSAEVIGIQRNKVR